MNDFKIFEGIEEDNINKLLKSFDSLYIKHKKDEIILSNVAYTRNFHIIKNGSASVIRYNYNGTRTIIEELYEGDIFGSFSASYSDDLYVMSLEDTEIVSFEYEKLINRKNRINEDHNTLLDNVLRMLSEKLRTLHQRIEIVTEKTIRDKLLAYFNMLSKKQITKNLVIPFSLTNLADFLSIDRAAMMREIRNLNDEGLIESKGVKIKLMY